MDRSMKSNANRTHEVKHESLGVFLVKLMNRFLGIGK